MSVIINSNLLYRSDIPTTLEYSITPIQEDYKCSVYLKLSIKNMEVDTDGLWASIGKIAFTLNGTEYEYNKYTSNTIYPYDGTNNLPLGFYKEYNQSSTDYKGVVILKSYEDSLVLYEGTIDVDYNKDGTLNLDLEVNRLMQENNAFNIEVPVEKASNGYIKVNNVWKNACVWKKINGVWKRGVLWKKINGIWKKGV